jgi:hypothetical protein
MDRIRRVQRKENLSSDVARITDRIQILDPEALANAIEATVRTRYGGSHVAAAKAVALSRTTLNRLAKASRERNRGKGGHVSIDVFRKLEVLLEDRAELDYVFLTSQAAETLRRYSNWLIQQSQIPKAEFRYRSVEIERLLGRIRKEVPTVANALLRWLDPSEIAYSTWVEALGGDRIWGKLYPRAGISALRCDVMILRMLDPLMQVYATGGIERSADELSPTEFRRFIEQSWRREEIMLNRESDFARAQGRWKGGKVPS